MERRTPIDHLRILAKEGTETERRLRVAEAVFNGMMSAYRNHKALGEAGRKKDKVNQFGDFALRADIEAEEHVLQELTRWAEENQVSLTYRGEEVGEGVVGKVDEEPYFTVIDGIDGSDNYLNETPWPYGTMGAVAKGENPTYDDFEVAGIMMPEEGWIVLAIKYLGVWVYDIDSGQNSVLPRFDTQESYDSSKVLADDYFPEAKKLIGDKADVWSRTGSTAATAVAIAIRNHVQEPIDKYSAMNAGWQGLVDVTRKGNLEQPVVFRVISELGGDMVDKDGKSIRFNKFKDWGQEEKLPVITTQNENILRGVMSEITP